MILFGGSFDASAEWRRRARFAVLSALEFHGYRPENADALGYYVAKLQNDEGLPLFIRRKNGSLDGKNPSGQCPGAMAG